MDNYEYDDDAPAAIIDLDSPEAVDALVRLAGHLPEDVEIGRPLLAMTDPRGHAVQFMTRHGIWASHPAHVERLAALGADGSVTELTEWVGRREVSRFAMSTQDLGRP
jgi:hypothetical protein